MTTVWAWLFALSLGVIAYTYAGYPLLIGALARWHSRPWHRAPWPHTLQPGLSEPPLSVVMAVHNGGVMLPAQLEHLLGLDPALVREVLVVSDGSTDATDGILARAANPRLRTFALHPQAGKTAAVNHGVAHAQGEIVLFVDIRPRIEPGALAALLSNFADPTVGCVAGELLLHTDGHDGAASAVSGLYWKYEQWIRNCEAAVDSPVGVYGGFYAVRRTLVTPAPPGLILDDMFQPLAVIRQGFRSVLDRTALVTDRWPAKAAGEFSRKVRTLAGNFQLLREAPWVLSTRNRVLFQLVSHKLLRLVVPYCFVALLLSSAALALAPQAPLLRVAFAAFTLAQAALWTLAVLALRFRIPVVGRIASPASALLVLNAAAVAGLWRFLVTRGPLWRTWKPTAAP